MSPHGLVYPSKFLNSLPVLLPRPAPHQPIRAISAPQFAKIRNLHLTSDVPDNVLFPFLHGLEGDNHQQNLFFSKHGDHVSVPNYRGLIWVIADDDDVFPAAPKDNDNDDEQDEDELFLEDDDQFDIDLPSSSPRTVPHGRAHSDASSMASSLASSVDSIFSSDMSSSSSVSISTAATSVHSPNSNESCSFSQKQPPNSCLLTSTFRPHELLTTTPKGPAFIPPSVPKGISLRNFGIQVPIYATLSDIVIYSPKGLTRAAFALAERFKLAIEAKALERGMRTHSPSSSPRSSPISPLVAYNVFILSDPFSTLESSHPSLLATSSTGAPLNLTSFPHREALEMQHLTRASSILPGVYIGNTADVPTWAPGAPDAPFDSNVTNPEGYDVCIECHDAAGFPSSGLLKQAEEHLAALDALWATGYPAPAFFTGSSAPPRPAPNANTIIHFSFPASPPASQASMTALLPFINFLQGILHRARRAKILLYSHDGYTESSVLALALIMAEKRCALPEAYLELQVTRGRSFFVHNSDLGILRRMEQKFAPRERRERERDGGGGGREGQRWGWGALMGRSSTMLLSSSVPNVGVADHVSGGGGGLGRKRAQTSPLLPALVDHQTWFNDPRFDGSFPSRVLPFLYLGNLNHASNAYMLHALGITHVVSVGECALVPPADGAGVGQNEEACVGVEQVVMGKEGSLWKEEREGRIKVLDVKDVCDDGIDSLRHEFSGMCEWIEQARLSGGKVLVHCRVGVSRSATVTIAYVMKHLSLPLVDAYLIVRSRRLSVLIQPNMRLLYNLCGWEVELARQRVSARLPAPSPHSCSCSSSSSSSSSSTSPECAGCKDEDAREEALSGELKKSLNWPYLAREVHLLNEKYLH